MIIKDNRYKDIGRTNKYKPLIYIIGFEIRKEERIINIEGI
jgi:hypothetical protein